MYLSLLYIILFHLLVHIDSIAQAELTRLDICGFDEWLATNTIPASVDSVITSIAKEISIKKQHQQSIDSITIPVVIHVIHNGGIENISDDQIYSQITSLNEDFRKRIGSRGDGNRVDTKIQFCIAKIDPEGRCTNGIVRIKSSLTNHQQNQHQFLNLLSFWNSNRYLNIYIVKNISGSTLGYSSFPGGPIDVDGVVIKHSAFGRIGTAKPPNHLGRTLTHEISHWFGVYHTFHNGCGVDTCIDGDKVCDTPPVALPNYGCPKEVNSCHVDSPDLNDQITNYTDYTDDLCKNMFTQGQKNRMYATLTSFRTNIWQDKNLISMGCYIQDTNITTCPVIADFTTLVRNVCMDAKLDFINRSQNNPTKWDWLFPGGIPSESNSENPLVTYPISGTYSVGLIASNINSSDTLYLDNYISVSEPSPGLAIPYGEGFEDVVFPSHGMTIDNPDSGVTWQRTTKSKKISN